MQKPNIIMIMTDQQRYDTINELGFPYMITPNLDRLVREGISFQHTFCTAPSCTPSRASFFNCQYPSTLDVFHNNSKWDTSWIELLNNEGYHCINVGKMHTNPLDVSCGFDQRFVVENKDRPLGLTMPHGGFYDEWDKFLINNNIKKPSRYTYQSEHPNYDKALGAFEWPLEEKYHPDVFVGDMAKRIIEQRKSNNPFFMQIGFPGPHPPYDPPKRFLKQYKDRKIPIPKITNREKENQPYSHAAYRNEAIVGNHDAIKWDENPTEEQLQYLRKHYAANVTLIDEKVGEILETLEAKGYLDDAIIMFTSDHGDCLGDHGHIQKWTMYESVVRVPMILWSPNRLPKNLRSNALIQHMDIPATLFEMLDMKTPETWEAKSLLSDLNGGREFVFSEHAQDSMLKEVQYMTMVRNNRFKLVHYLDSEDGELYDLTEDPKEINNLWRNTKYQEIKNSLLFEILNWRIKNIFKKVPKDEGSFQ